MSASGRPMIGVLGGMGPMATVELLRRVVESTPARDDGDHIHMFVDNNPHVPSRIAALVEGGGTSPEAELRRMARRLRDGGCDLLVMPCNTAHFYVDAVREESGLEVLDIVSLTMSRLSRRRPAVSRVGILGSKAVERTGLFARACQSVGMEAVFPVDAQADALMDLIKGVKSNAPREELRRRFGEILETYQPNCGRNPDVLLVACSELSMLYTPKGEREGVEDSLRVLVDEILRRGGVVNNQQQEGRKQ